MWSLRFLALTNVRMHFTHATRVAAGGTQESVWLAMGPPSSVETLSAAMPLPAMPTLSAVAGRATPSSVTAAAAPTSAGAASISSWTAGEGWQSAWSGRVTAWETPEQPNLWAFLDSLLQEISKVWIKHA